MDTYAYKSIQCSRCSQKSLIDTTFIVPCPHCGTVLNPRPQKPRRNFSEKKTRTKQVQKHEVQKTKPKEEEKKKPVRKSLKPEKKFQKEPLSLKPKNKEIAPQVKKTKKKKAKRPRHSPREANYIDFYSDEVPNEGYFSDSFEEFYVDSPVFGFNPLYYAPSSGFRNSFHRGLLNRVSQNLFSLFFDGFAEIEYIPHLSAFQNETETISIGDLLRNLVAMHPDQATPANPEVVANIPVVRVNEAIKRSGACSICQEDFKIGENVKKLRCTHYYHGHCIDPWLAAKNTCPVCREVV